MAQQNLKVRLSADASRFSRGMRSARGSFLSFKTAAVVGAAAVAAGIAKAESAYAKFDEKMKESQAIMGDLSQNTMAEMQEAALEVSRTTQVSANDAAESFFFLASAGLDAQESIDALPKVAKFAQAGMFGMAQATDLLTDAQSALGLRMEDPIENMREMTRISDVLVKANTLANASVQQFSEALTNRAAAAMKATNIELEEGVAVLAAFADQGTKARRAGMFLSRMLRILRTSAAENQELFRNLGLVDAEGNMASMADVVEILTEELQGLSTIQQGVRLEQLGLTARMQDAILPLLGTSDAIREYEGSLRDASGITEEVADKQMLSLAQRADLAKDRFNALAIAIGEDLLPAFVATLEKTNFLLSALENLISTSERASRSFDLGLIETQLTGAVRETGLLADDANTILENVRRMTEELGQEQRPAFLEITSDIVQQLRRGSIDAAEAARQIVGTFETLEPQSKEVADNAENMAAGASAASTSFGDAADSVSDMSEELSKLPGLGVRGDAGSLGQALSVADELGVLDDFVERWKTARSTAMQYTEEVEDAESVHELIVGQMEDMEDGADGLVRETNRAVEGALDLAQAFSDVDSSIGQAIGGVLQLGASVQGVIQELGKAETSFATVAAGVGAGLSAIGSIVSAFTTKSPAERAAADLEVSVTLLSQNTEKLAQVVDQLGEVLTDQLLKFAEQFERFDVPTVLFGKGDIGEEVFADVRAELDRLGLTFLDVKKAAQAMGIDVSEFLKVLITGEGDMELAGEQLKFFMQALQELEGVEGETKTEAERLAEAMKEVSQSFRDARAASQLMIDVFDIENIGQQLGILIDDVSEAMGGPITVLEELRQMDLSTRSGIEAAKELLQQIFEQRPGALAGLPEDMFNELVSNIDDLLDQAMSDLERAAGAGAGTGGGVSGTISVGGRTTSPDFTQRSVITEVQAEERNVLLRSQLMQEEMQTDLQRMIIRVLADLPSNIRDGVDIALGEDQIAGGL